MLFTFCGRLNEGETHAGNVFEYTLVAMQGFGREAPAPPVLHIKSLPASGNVANHDKSREERAATRHAKLST